MFSGVLMRCRRLFIEVRPISIRIAQVAKVEISEVYTALFTFVLSLAPKRRELTTEQPTLQPKAKAMKIKVIS